MDPHPSRAYQIHTIFAIIILTLPCLMPNPQNPLPISPCNSIHESPEPFL